MAGVPCTPCCPGEHSGTFQRSSYRSVHKRAIEEGMQADNSGLIGLRNLANTCYLNASMQCLANTVPLVDYFLGFSQWRNEINKTNPLGTGGVLVEEFGKVISTIWRSQEETPLSLLDFKSALGKFNSQFAGNLQNDSHELLAFLLDGLHEDLNRVCKQAPISEEEISGNLSDADLAIASWKSYLLRNRSIIVDIFQGQLRNTLKCNICAHVSVKFDPFMYMSVPLPLPVDVCESLPLNMCLAEFCKPETLSGDCQWQCPNCAVPRDAEKKMDIWIAPPVLIVHLKRFRDGRRGRRTKINALVEFPTRGLDLSWYMSGDQPGSHVYDLYAVSNHHGHLYKGHYTAFAKNRYNKKWYQFNDTKVSEIAESDVCTSDAYVLFYNKVVNTGSDMSANDKDDYDMDDMPERLVQGSFIKRQSITVPQLWPHINDPTAPQLLRMYSFEHDGETTDIPLPASPVVDLAENDGDREKQPDNEGTDRTRRDDKASSKRIRRK